MADRTVAETSDIQMTNGYAATANELRRIADALDTLTPVGRQPYMQISILPNETVEDVDAVALAVLGKRGQTHMTDGKWRHQVDGRFTERGYISVHALVPGPPDPREAELEKLRAEVERLRNPTGLDFSREPDATEAGTVADGIEGGPVVGRGATS